MRTLLLASTVTMTTLGGCATIRDSAVNPFNWFGGSTTQVVVAEPQETDVNPLIPRRNILRDALFEDPDALQYAGTLVQEVTDLHVRRTVGGALVEATGIFRAMGSYDVRLVLQDDEDPSALTYEFRALQPRSGTGLGTPHARTVTAAVRLTEQELAGVTTIRVIAAGNIRTVRR